MPLPTHTSLQISNLVHSENLQEQSNLESDPDWIPPDNSNVIEEEEEEDDDNDVEDPTSAPRNYLFHENIYNLNDIMFGVHETEEDRQPRDASNSSSESISDNEEDLLLAPPRTTTTSTDPNNPPLSTTRFLPPPPPGSRTFRIPDPSSAIPMMRSEQYMLTRPEHGIHYNFGPFGSDHTNSNEPENSPYAYGEEIEISPNLIRGPTNRDSRIIGTTRQRRRGLSRRNENRVIIPSISRDILTRAENAIHRHDYLTSNYSNDSVDSSRSHSNLSSLINNVSRLSTTRGLRENYEGRRFRMNENNVDDTETTISLKTSFFRLHHGHEMICKPNFHIIIKKLNEFLRKRQQQGHLYDSTINHKSVNPLKRSYDESFTELEADIYKFQLTRVIQNSFLRSSAKFISNPAPATDYPITMNFNYVSYENNLIIGSLSAKTAESLTLFMYNLTQYNFKCQSSNRISFIGEFINFEQNDLRYVGNSPTLETNKLITINLQRQFNKWLSLKPFHNLKLNDFMSILICPKCILHLQEKYVLFILNMNDIKLLCVLDRSSGELEFINGNITGSEDDYCRDRGKVVFCKPGKVFTNSCYEFS